MPKIPNLLAFGKHCHNCGKWMERRALRKDLICNFCKEKIFARNGRAMQMCSRCIECDNIVLDNFNYCECCGLETERQIRKNRAREQHLKAKQQLQRITNAEEVDKPKLAQSEVSQDIFNDDISFEDIEQLEESLLHSHHEEDAEREVDDNETVIDSNK